MPRLLATHLFLAAILVAQSDGGTVTVRAIDSVTRAPVAGAEVTLAPFVIIPPLPSDDARPRFFRCATAADGACRLRNVAAGTYSVQWKRAGYAVWRRNQQLTVAGGGEHEATVALDPTANVEGTVLGEDNEPLPGAVIHAMDEWGGEYFGEADGDGKFRLESLAPGHYRFRLQFPAERIRTALRVRKPAGERWSYPPSSYHPGVDSVTQADLVALGPGVTLVDFELKARRMRLVQFDGRLVDAVTRQPLVAGEVELEPDIAGRLDEAWQRRRVSGTGASFAFAFLRPGRHRLQVYRDERRVAIPYSVTVEVGQAGLADQVVRVPAFGHVTGRLSKLLPGSRISLAQTGGRGGARVETVANAEGTFVFEGVAPGEVQLTANLDGGRYYARRVSGAGWNAAVSGRGHVFTVPEGGAQVLIEVSDEFGSVAGRVVDDRGEPVPKVRVQFEGGVGLAMPVLTDQTGHFRAANVTPGRRAFFVCRERLAEVDVTPQATASVTLRDCPRR